MLQGGKKELRRFLCVPAILVLSLAPQSQVLASARQPKPEIETNMSFSDRCWAFFRSKKRPKGLAAHFGLIANLPATLPVAVHATHHYRFEDPVEGSWTGEKATSRILKGVIPLPEEGNFGYLIDLNAIKHHQEWPRRFVISDGSLSRSFIGVDQTPGSPLDRRLKAIYKSIESRLNYRVTKESLLELLVHNVADFMGPVQNSDASGGPQLPWDLAIDQRLRRLELPKVEFFRHSVSFVPIYVQMPVQPLESYIDQGEGYCIQQALLASLILRHYNVHHRFVNGSTAIKPGYSYGHTWIELADGRILDLSARILEKPIRAQEARRMGIYPRQLLNDDWYYLPSYKIFDYGSWHDAWRFEVAHYLALDLDKPKSIAMRRMELEPRKPAGEEETPKPKLESKLEPKDEPNVEPNADEKKGSEEGSSSLLDIITRGLLG